MQPTELSGQALKKWALWLALITLCGGLLRAYGINDHWKSKDHYNFGGPLHSRFTFCIRHSPWAESRGRMHTGCSAEGEIALSPLVDELAPAAKEKALGLHESKPFEPVYYLNHPPLYPLVMAAATELLGEHEWVFRSVTLVFSILNIVLIALLVLRLTRKTTLSLFAASLQAGFLGTIYFGTHVDYTNEMHATFIILCTYAVVAEAWGLAALCGLIAGFNDWPGYMILPGLWFVSYLLKQGRAATTAALIVMPLAIVGFATYLVGVEKIIDLFHRRLLHSGHVAEPHSMTEWLAFPFEWARTLFVTHSRLLGPLPFALAVVTLAQMLTRAMARTRAHGQTLLSELLKMLREQPVARVLFLMASNMVIISVIGAPYVMLHPFWFIPTLSFWAILLACTDVPTEIAQPKLNRALFGLTLFIAAAFYPYGIYKSDPAFDVCASAVIALSALVVLAALFGPSRLRVRLSLAQAIQIGLALTLAGNFMEVVNYRTEPATDHNFCLQALTAYLESGTKVDLGPEPSLSRLYYCRAIPTQ